MTAEDFGALVRTALSRHLLKEYWDGLPEGTREAALSMASSDCLALLGWSGDDLPDSAPLQVVAAAVAEQAVFLARHYEDNEGGKIVASESAGGVSQSFAIAKSVTEGTLWSARAKGLLEAVRRMRAGALRIARG